MEPSQAAEHEASGIKDRRTRAKYLRVMEGSRRRDAIHLYCYMMCKNWDFIQVARCPNSACPLWPYRARPKRDKPPRKRKPVVDITPTVECTQCKAQVAVLDAEPCQDEKGDMAILCPKCRK